MTPIDTYLEPDESVRKAALVGYALYALSLVVGLSALVAIVLNYVKRDDARGTWLESHYAWQIKTFWWALLFFVVGALTTFILIGFVILFAALIWYIYRIVKGWLAFNDKKPIF